ncbi:hypothetical protein B9Z55_017388 [Caenorhabditis nigoni]|uniref:BTB domain-containing protein n=1 Tax=Caenorhabditis nigoni TaxID=1611254 RepID=A0A2G5T8W8_9PELO|nr:hypothetical protein B9Z55_017388 [Caenorhabditis nigoni]
MTEKVIEYKSEQRVFQYKTTVELEKGSKDGLNWVTIYKPQLSIYSRLVESGFISWTFEWTELQKEGIDGFSGFIQVYLVKDGEKIPHLKYDVQLNACGQKITRRLGMFTDLTYDTSSTNIYCTYEFNLKSYNLATRTFPIDQLFISSADTDAILVVENYKIYVNKTFLSMHSDYFRSLFSANFKEASLSEIPIEEVKYEEFARLLALIHPKPITPTDESVESLLKLAEYFQMPAVICHVEQFLLGASHFDFFQLLFVADKYKMEKLIEKCIGMITTLDHVKRVKAFPEYENLAHITKSKILDRLMQVV